MKNQLDAAPWTAIAHTPMSGYQGPDRRAADQPAWQWLAATLDEIDYGMLLLDREGSVLHINEVARSELDAGHPLRLTRRQLSARRARDLAPLGAALAAARQGLRKLLTVGDPGHELGVSVVPLGQCGGAGQMLTLLILGKRRVCAELAAQAFARSHGLTPGETRILQALCDGMGPAAAAEAHGVALSTVRTHISSIRSKTGIGSMREIVRKVASLPPLMGVLRRGGATLRTLPASAGALAA